MILQVHSCNQILLPSKRISLLCSARPKLNPTQRMSHTLWLIASAGLCFWPASGPNDLHEPRMSLSEVRRVPPVQVAAFVWLAPINCKSTGRLAMRHPAIEMEMELVSSYGTIVLNLLSSHIGFDWLIVQWPATRANACAHRPQVARSQWALRHSGRADELLTHSTKYIEAAQQTGNGKQNSSTQWWNFLFLNSAKPNY